MKTINELLKMTPDEYQMHVMNWWTTYCFAKSHTSQQAQKLLTNNTLYQWWNAQLAFAEKEFTEDSIPYNREYTQEDATKLYARHAYRLQKYFNPNLIKAALS